VLGAAVAVVGGGTGFLFTTFAALVWLGVGVGLGEAVVVGEVVATGASALQPMIPAMISNAMIVATEYFITLAFGWCFLNTLPTPLPE
jgi:hypothetical protein